MDIVTRRISWDEYESGDLLPPAVFIVTPDPEDNDAYGVVIHSDGELHVEARTREDDVELIKLTQEQFDAFTS